MKKNLFAGVIFVLIGMFLFIELYPCPTEEIFLYKIAEAPSGDNLKSKSRKIKEILESRLKFIDPEMGFEIKVTRSDQIKLTLIGEGNYKKLVPYIVMVGNLQVGTLNSDTDDSTTNRIMYDYEKFEGVNIGDEQHISNIKKIRKRDIKEIDLETVNQRNYFVINLKKPATNTFYGLTTSEGSKDSIRLAFMLDGKIFSAPIVLEPIEKGRMRLNTPFSKLKAKSILSLIKTKRLPSSLNNLRSKKIKRCPWDF